jgi:heme-degrading monooxygenase HmoA
MDVVRLGDAEVRLLPVVRGLPSEAEAVTREFKSAAIDVIALSVSREEIESLRRFHGESLQPDNVEDEVYMAGLSAWEEPVMPPPCFTEAVRQAAARGVRLEALDLDEEAYADAYTECVSAIELMMQGRMEMRLSRKKFHVSSPEEFVIAWDGEVNRRAGFAALQHRRERHMASRLRELATDAGRVLAVVEVERAKGVLAGLRG